MDEAGRGPLAGPVYAACVILPEDFPAEFARDSKKLSARQRLQAEIVIKTKALAWGLGSATPWEIDHLNILQATFLAMKRAIQHLRTQFPLVPEFELWVDGNQVPPLEVTCHTLVKGDNLMKEIGAASILAKTARDRYMMRWSWLEPQYQFEQHKGYGTQLHRRLIQQYGPGKLHRFSFLTKILP